MPVSLAPKREAQKKKVLELVLDGYSFYYACKLAKLDTKYARDYSYKCSYLKTARYHYLERQGCKLQLADFLKKCYQQTLGSDQQPERKLYASTT